MFYRLSNGKSNSKNVHNLIEKLFVKLKSKFIKIVNKKMYKILQKFKHILIN